MLKNCFVNAAQAEVVVAGDKGVSWPTFSFHRPTKAMDLCPLLPHVTIAIRANLIDTIARIYKF